MAKSYFPMYNYNCYTLYEVCSDELGLSVPDQILELGTYRVRETASVKRAFLYRLKTNNILCNSNKVKVIKEKDGNYSLVLVYNNKPLYRFIRTGRIEVC